MMKNFMTYLTLIFFFATTVALGAVITDDKVELGKPSSTADKQVIFSGPTKKKLTHKNATNTLEYDGNNLTVGDGANTSKVLKFNKGASSPEIRYNSATSKLEFTNDASVYKAIGSGSGAGSGINLLDNAGFEDGVAVSWTSSGTSLVEANTGSNLLYELKSATWTPTATAHFFESTAVTVPNILYAQDCMAKIIYKGGDANAYLTVMDGSSVELIPTTSRLVLSSASGVKTAKVYFTCPSSGSVKLRVQSTAAMVIASFDQAHLGQADFNGASNTIASTPYTPIITGFGTVTGLQAFYSRNQDKLKVWGAFTTGTSTGVSGRISLPNIGGQLNLDVSKLLSLQRQRLGFATKALVSTTTQMPAVTVGPFVIIADTATSTSEVFFSVQTNTTANHYLVATGTNVSASSGEMVNFEFEVPISGWSTLENSINSKCLNDVACENSFGALMVVPSAVVSNENLDWINGNCVKNSTGNFTCTFNSGVFTSTPNCSILTAGGLGTSAAVVNTTSTNINFVTFVSNTGVVGDAPVYMTCQKSGSDFKAKQTIQGFLSSTVTSAANNLRIEYAKTTTTCSSSPCAIAYQSGGFLSITRASTGNYSPNFVAGTFSAPPSCQVIVGAQGVNVVMSTSLFALPTTSGFTFGVLAGGAAYDTSGFDITCVGPR